MEDSYGLKTVAKRITGTGQVWGGPCYIRSVRLCNDTEVGKVIIYDHDSAANNPIVDLTCAINGNDSWYPSGRIEVRYGIYAAVTGSHSAVNIELENFPSSEQPQ